MIKFKARLIQQIKCTWARPEGLHFHGPAYELIKKLQGMKVLSGVDYPTEWVSLAKIAPRIKG